MPMNMDIRESGCDRELNRVPEEIEVDTKVGPQAILTCFAAET